MAPWEVLSINNPKRMPGQGSTFLRVYAPLLFDQFDPKCYSLCWCAPQAICFCTIHCQSCNPLKCKSGHQGVLLFNGTYCFYPAPDVVGFLNLSTERNQEITRLPTEEKKNVLNAYRSQNHWAWALHSSQDWQVVYVFNPSTQWINGNMRQAAHGSEPWISEIES